MRNKDEFPIGAKCFYVRDKYSNFNISEYTILEVFYVQQHCSDFAFMPTDEGSVFKELPKFVTSDLWKCDSLFWSQQPDNKEGILRKHDFTPEEYDDYFELMVCIYNGETAIIGQRTVSANQVFTTKTAALQFALQGLREEMQYYSTKYNMLNKLALVYANEVNQLNSERNA
jgi:hypothetical protein